MGSVVASLSKHVVPSLPAVTKFKTRTASLLWVNSKFFSFLQLPFPFLSLFLFGVLVFFSAIILLVLLFAIMSEMILLHNETTISCRRFTLTEVLLATDSFSDDQVIGKGGFGKVYKGFIKNGAVTVAIKRLNAESKQGVREFWTEIITLFKLRYTHLVNLIGYADEKDEMILVYEYIPNGTLAENLYRSPREQDSGDWYRLTWEQRLNICIGAALGLQYLHETSIIHRDVKTTNILLDENFVAKIADFGLSKMTHLQSHVSTDVKGTFGYLDPEYFFTHRLTMKSDVYAFGVVLLEVVCGRPPVDTSFEEAERRSLALWAEKCFKKGRLFDMIDPYLREQVSPISLKMFTKVAINCLNKDSKRRPSMAELVRSLEFVLASESDARQNKGIVAGLSSSIARIFRSGRPNRDVLQGRPVTCMRHFTLTEVRAATDHFNKNQMISSGSHKDVYRGLIDRGTREVAIMKWKKRISHPQINIIRMEIEVQSQLHDLNLVSLIGYYIDEHEVVLVYEYMANGSLHDQLYKTNSSALSWEKRLNIGLSIAQALHYLRTKWPSIHRYLKLTDILLDKDWNPKISGFLYPSFTHDESKDHEADSYSELFAANKQYIDPEFYVTQIFSEESDVYSFGVILLELLCGRNLLIYEGFIRMNIANWFTENWVDGLPVLIDPCLSSLIAPKCLESYVLIALSCVNFDRVKRPTIESVLISLERALQVQRIWLEQQFKVVRMIERNKLGSDVSNFKSSSGVISGMGSKQNKLSLLAFEIANTIARGANVMESLAEEKIQLLKTEILQSEGVRLLVSVDMKELLSFAAAEIREKFDVFCHEVNRFGDLCTDPQWHNLGRYFCQLGRDSMFSVMRVSNAHAAKKQDRAEAEKIFKELTTLAQHISIGTRFSPDIEELKAKAVHLSQKGESVMILQSELKHQRKVIEDLKRKSLWAKSLDKVVEKLLDVVIFIQLEITEVFSDTCLMTPGNSKPERLGVANLSLHYANIINQIDNISSRPMSLPSSVRDELYQGLPNSVKVALRSRCQPYHTPEELTVPQIRAEIKKTMNWLVPVATNTINFHLKRAHQGYGCSEFGKNGSLSNSIIRLQTLHHAEKEKVDHYILELVTWLQRLVPVARERDYGITTLPTRH